MEHRFDEPAFWNAVPIPILAVGGDGRVTMNRAAEEFPDIDLRRLFEGPRGTELDAFLRALDSNLPAVLRLRVEGVGGHARHLSLQGRDGLVVVHDVTEQRRLEEENAELRRVELVGHLSASMAHDFNNLLTIISATSTLLAMETRGRDTEQELVNEIATACERASGLVRALLSRLRGGSAVAAPVDVNCAVRDLLPLVERLAGASVEVELDLDPHACEPFIVREAFEHALLNLVTNARDAMPEGGRLTIATRDMAMDADDSNSTTPHYVAVVVTDTGRGMSPFVRDRAFDRLFTTKGPGAGSGLGLASVRRFAVESRGCVSVHSAVGQGTSIRIYVPCCAPERAQRCEVTSSSPYEFPAFCVGC